MILMIRTNNALDLRRDRSNDFAETINICRSIDGALSTKLVKCLLNRRCDVV